MIKDKLPQNIVEIIKEINSNGYKGYLVGGAIRDILLNKNPSDYDIATNANIEELLIIFRDYKIIATGLKHGTITIHLNKQDIEITTFRSKNNELKDDLRLRDFSINSLAYELDGSIIDYTNGIKDLKNKLLKVNDSKRFKEDPIRILRALRMACQYDFHIEDETKKAIFRYKDLLINESAERINNEFSKLIICNNAYLYIEEYVEIFSLFIKELKPMIGFNQYNKYHKYDVFMHSLYTLKEIKNKKVSLCLAALLHDVAKPNKFTLDENGNGHFYGHPELGCQMATDILKKLKYSNKIINEVAMLIHYHDFKITNKKIIIKLLNLFGNKSIFDLYDLKRSDINAHSDFYQQHSLKKLNEIYDITKKIIDEQKCIKLSDLAINGNDLIAIGYKQGTPIGECLNKLLELVIDDEKNNTFEFLIEYAKNIIK